MARKTRKEAAKKPAGAILAAIAVAILAAVVIFWAAEKDKNRQEIPAQLTGRWITTAPGYEDRYLEINRVSMVFATSETTVSEYFFSSFTASDKNKGTEFNFECKTLQGELYRFVIIYQRENGGTLFFKNQQEIRWVKNTP